MRPLNETTTLEDLQRNPHEYGLPTLEEFMKDPDKWRLPDSHNLNVLDNGSQGGLRKLIREQIYDYNGYRTRSLEHLEHILLNEGLSPKDIEMRGELLKDIAGKYAVLFTIKRKAPKDGTKNVTVDNSSAVALKRE